MIKIIKNQENIVRHKVGDWFSFNYGGGGEKIGVLAQIDNSTVVLVDIDEFDANRANDGIKVGDINCITPKEFAVITNKCKDIKRINTIEDFILDNLSRIKSSIVLYRCNYKL